MEYVAGNLKRMGVQKWRLVVEDREERRRVMIDPNTSYFECVEVKRIPAF